ncbi:MAG: IPT/TIG domain-containing protein, partial [Anaerolineae bacterium]
MNKLTIGGLVSTLLLLLTAVLILEVGASPPPLPTVTAITPNTGPADRQTAVTISGQGFVLTSTAHLDTTPLLAITFVDSSTLNARVPFGLPTGVYTLTVTNAESGVLTRAYTVTAGSAGWSSNGPYGGQTRDLAIHPTLTGTVYVAAEQAGLYRTTDGGLTWEQVLYSSAAPVGFVHVWPADPDVVFFGREDGLYRSEAGGDPGTWTAVAFPGQTGAQPSALAIAAGDPHTLYCATGDSLFYSADGGSTWMERGAGLPGVPWRLAASPDDAATAYASYQDGSLYKTTNAGLSWALLPFSVPPTSDGEGGITVLVTDPYRPDTVWVGTWMQGLHRSTDGGQTFSEVDALYTVGHQSGFWSISFDPNQDRVFVGVSGPNDAVYYSDDGGDSWHGLGLNNQGGADVAVPPGDSDTIYTTWAGVRKSTDGGQTWTWLSQGISAIRPWRIAVSPLDPDRVLTVADADGAFGTHNAGNEW